MSSSSDDPDYSEEGSSEANSTNDESQTDDESEKDAESEKESNIGSVLLQTGQPDIETTQKPIAFGLERIKKLSMWMDLATESLAKTYLPSNEKSSINRNANSREINVPQNRQSRNQIDAIQDDHETFDHDERNRSKKENYEDEKNKKYFEDKRDVHENFLESLDDEDPEDPIPRLMRNELVQEAIGTLMGVEDLSM